jgi:phage-related protein
VTAPTLNDYEYQFKDSGVLVNGDASTPFWDVSKVSGLVDFPTLNTKILDRDGRHGSSVYVRYFTHRVIVIEGTLYASSSDFDTPLEAMRTSLLPDDVYYPFYFKHPNQSQRYLSCKSTDFKCDVEVGRRIGSSPFQIQLTAGDPRHYIDGSVVNWTTAVNFNLHNTGNTACAPTISITASSTTTANVTVQNVTTGLAVQFTTAVTSADVITVDLDQYAIKVNGTYRPVPITLTTNWPFSNPGVTEAWKVTSNVGNGTSTDRSAWL